MSKRIVSLIAVTIAAATAAGLAYAQALPEGKGKDTVQAICTGCHDLSPITDSIGFSKADWEIVVKSMIDMGATIKAEQIPEITDYLATAFPPKK
jgi:virginiamycin B lyase